MPNSAARGPIVLLTDFGTGDVYAGVMKGVIASIAPGVAVIDLSHEIARHDVRAAAWALLFSYRYFPAGSIFCCVVDPGVGTGRGAIVAELREGSWEGFFVGPDNGLLTPLLDKITTVNALEDRRYRLAEVSATFHGRDLFAPAAAHLAAGVAVGEFGEPSSPSTVVQIPWPTPRRLGEGWQGAVVHVDEFGNLITNLPGATLEPNPAAWQVQVAGKVITGIRRTFGEAAVAQLVAYVGSSGFLEIAVREGNAGERLRAGVGSEILLTGA